MTKLFVLNGKESYQWVQTVSGTPPAECNFPSGSTVLEVVTHSPRRLKPAPMVEYAGSVGFAYDVSTEVGRAIGGEVSRWAGVTRHLVGGVEYEVGIVPFDRTVPWVLEESEFMEWKGKIQRLDHVVFRAGDVGDLEAFRPEWRLSHGSPYLTESVVERLDELGALAGFTVDEAGVVV